jgi:integrase
LGGDLRAADRNHAGAVARLQAQIAKASRTGETDEMAFEPVLIGREITLADHEHAAWTHYSITIEGDEQKRAAMPTPVEIDAELERLMQRIDAGEADAARNPVGMFNLYTDYELKAGARHFGAKLRNRRLAALQASLASGDTRLVDAAVQKYVDENQLNVRKGSSAWRDLAFHVTRAIIDALKQTLRRDLGDYSSQPLDPILKPPTSPDRTMPKVPLKQLFKDYIVKKQAEGTHRDGGANWAYQNDALVKFLGHDDARKLSSQNLMDWRDFLLASGKSAKTVSGKYLAAIRAVLTWAAKEKRLPSNEAATVHQGVAKKIQSREKGYTTHEAVAILNVSISHQPTKVTNPSNRESAHMTFAKRWVPLLCAFTGARVTEITQLRKEDVRLESERWILRITPEAGSVKTGQYRDVPLHKQVLDLGFIEFLKAAKSGPLFHNAQNPVSYLARARVTSGKLSEWLQSLNLVPNGVQPSHGWRHRFKTQGRELGVSDRVIDAIQGHAGRTGGDDYGDVTVAARLRVIDSIPHYNLEVLNPDPQ